MKVIDLSQTISPEMSVFPGSNPPIINQVADIKSDFYMEHKLEFTTHIGTHIDAPGHILEKGEILIDKEVSQYVGSGYVLDVSSVKEITVKELKTIEGLEHIEFLLFYTSFGESFGTKAYLGTFPVLNEEALSYILEKGVNLKGIGVDCFSVDTLEPLSLKNHIKILGNGLIIIENLKGLHELIDKIFILSVLPLKVIKIEGSPVRAIALIFED